MYSEHNITMGINTPC